jgi:opacity protein-like surface antigen
MKLTSSIVAIMALSGMSFAGGMIMEPAYENEIVEVPVEPIPLPVVQEIIQEQPIVQQQQPVVQQPIVKEAVVKTPVVVPVKPDPVTVSEGTGFYVAGGLTNVGVRPNGTLNLFANEEGQDRQAGFTGRIGYDFMNYLGAELRGTYGVAKDKSNKFKQMGAYLKPNYDVTDEINLYGLFGASQTDIGFGSDTGLSYGAGLDYGITDKVSVFTDVVNYLEKSKTAAQWGLTVGAAYQF